MGKIESKPVTVPQKFIRSQVD
ncbi:uncharacterized protein G2W53_021301 [Senna tora]|uniref:Uncharacterized protein n=1 Tax=Senna tora TaxID=362788 RepID=A0A834TKU1_9FABA|nr:uncharacterized protein G2W53_021301 [Senna tora]